MHRIQTHTRDPRELPSGGKEPCSHWGDSQKEPREHPLVDPGQVQHMAVFNLVGGLRKQGMVRTPKSGCCLKEEPASLPALCLLRQSPDVEHGSQVLGRRR